MSEKKVTLSILTYYDERLKEWVLEQIGENGNSTNIFNLKGTVLTIDELPLTDNKVGDVYLVGPKEDNSYDEYFWTENAWEFLGTTAKDIDETEITLNNELYAGSDGLGTPSNPAEGTVLAQLKKEIESSSDLEII